MASKLCFLLLGLCALVAVIQAAPKRSEQSEIALKTFAKRSLKSKRDDDEDITREEFIEFLKQLTPEDVEKLTDQEKVGIVFLIYLFEVQPHEIEKRNALVNVAKRSVMKKRDDDELTREEFIAFLNSLTKEDIDKLTDEEKMGLIFLILLFDVQEDEINIQKRDGGYGNDYDYYDNVNGLKEKQLAFKTLVKRSLFEAPVQGSQLPRCDCDEGSRTYFAKEFDSDQDDDDYKVEEINKRSLNKRSFGCNTGSQTYFEADFKRSLNKRSFDCNTESQTYFADDFKRSLNKRNDDELTREEFIQFLKTLKTEDLEKLTEEEKLAIIFLIYVFEVEPHELERRSSGTNLIFIPPP